MVSRQPEHVDSPRNKRYSECLETQRGRERWKRAGVRLGRCWSGGVPSHSPKTAASETVGQLPRAEEVHQKKENAGKKPYRGCKNLDKKHDLYRSFRPPIKRNGQEYISCWIWIIFFLQKTDTYSSSVLCSSCLRDVLFCFCPDQ